MKDPFFDMSSKSSIWEHIIRIRTRLRYGGHPHPWVIGGVECDGIMFVIGSNEESIDSWSTRALEYV